jgi:thiopurine S-methyltransferase
MWIRSRRGRMSMPSLVSNGARGGTADPAACGSDRGADADFWHQRWRDHQIGFHQSRVTPLLEQYWDAIEVPAGGRVFVPLCGKSLDLVWLAGRGHRVLGVELSQLAVNEFFAEQALSPIVQDAPYGRRHVAGNIEIVCGDVFALDADALAGCTGVYDRAALIALPRQVRERYTRDVYSRLPGGCRGLLVTLEYPQHEKNGPPFPVHGDEVELLYSPDWRVHLLERCDILATQPGFVAEGVTRLHTSAWELHRR